MFDIDLFSVFRSGRKPPSVSGWDGGCSRPQHGAPPAPLLAAAGAPPAPLLQGQQQTITIHDDTPSPTFSVITISDSEDEATVKVKPLPQQG